MDTRTHVMGDMLMVTGTFTDGGTDVSYDGMLASVFAAGGHVTSLYNTGVVKNGAASAGDGSSNTTFTVKTVDMRLHFNVGESVTLNDGSLAVSIDETNKRVVFGNGNLGAASTAHIQDGRWWILGQRS